VVQLLLDKDNNGLDELDYKILKLLEMDAFITYAELSKGLNVNQSTIRKRIVSLRKRGIIRKASIYINPKKLGFEVVALLEMQVAPAKTNDVVKKLMALSENKWVTVCLGDCQVHTVTWARNLRHLSEVISEKIGPIEGILRVSTSLVIDTVKEEQMG